MATCPRSRRMLCFHDPAISHLSSAQQRVEHRFTSIAVHDQRAMRRHSTVGVVPRKVMGVVALLGLTVVTGCGSAFQDVGTAPPGQEPTGVTEAAQNVDVSVAGAPAEEATLIEGAVAALGADLVMAVRLDAAPQANFESPEGIPGDRWLYVDVATSATNVHDIEQFWQVARLAGEVRTTALAHGLPAPHGYSIIRVLPDGTLLEPFEIALGVASAKARAPEETSERKRIEEAAAARGLTILSMEFQGTDFATIVRLQTAEDPRGLLKRWGEIRQTVIGDRETSPWFIEIVDADGSPLRVLATSPATGGGSGWTRPDLRAYELELRESSVP